MDILLKILFAPFLAMAYIAEFLPFPKNVLGAWMAWVVFFAIGIVVSRNWNEKDGFAQTRCRMMLVVLAFVQLGFYVLTYREVVRSDVIGYGSFILMFPLFLFIWIIGAMPARIWWCALMAVNAGVILLMIS